MKGKKEVLIAETAKVISGYTTRLTIRQIFYRLVSKHIIENTVGEYKYLDKVLVDARWDRKIRFRDIEDRTRQFIGGDEELSSPESTFTSWLNAFKNCSRYHTLPYWLDQENYIEVWLEKQALQGIFQEVTDKWKVRLFPCRGYPSLTKLYEASGNLQSEGEGKNVKILYFGDYDPSGEDIPRKIEEDLQRFGINFEIHKVAILKEQIEEYNIPPFPAKTSDPRYAKFAETHGDEAVELDAIDPKDLAEIIHSAIRDEFDTSVREEVEDRQTEERKQIEAMVRKVLKPEKKTKKRKKR